MTTYYVVRDEKLQLRLERATVDSLGITVVVGPSQLHDDEPGAAGPTHNIYVVDGKLAEQDGVLDTVMTLAAAGQWCKIDAKYLVGPGESKSGLLALTQPEWDAYRKAASLIHQYGTEGGRAQGARIDMLLDDDGWTAADRLLDRGGYVCQFCERHGVGDHLDGERLTGPERPSESLDVDEDRNEDSSASPAGNAPSPYDLVC